MAKLSEIIDAVSLVPNIIGGVASVISLVRGISATPTAQALTTPGQAALFSGGTAGRVLSTGAQIGSGPSVGPIGGLAGDFVQAVAPIAARAVLPTVQRVAGVPAFVGAGAAAGVRTVTRRQLILMTARARSPGATAKKIIKAAKDCGLELAAATFGLSVLDVCFLLAQPATRRARGISAADLRRTRSTIRKVTTIQQSLKALSGPIRRRK